MKLGKTENQYVSLASLLNLVTSHNELVCFEVSCHFSVILTEKNSENISAQSLPNPEKWNFGRAMESFYVQNNYLAQQSFQFHETFLSHSINT